MFLLTVEFKQQKFSLDKKNIIKLMLFDMTSFTRQLPGIYG